MKRLRNYWLLFLQGLGIGTVDIIPGVSGGTMALIMGIYEELLQSIQAFNVTALRLLTAGQFRTLWQYLNGAFLFPLLLGIGLSLATTVQLVIYLLAYHPIQTWSFFLGLLLVSAFTIYQRVRQWRLRTVFVSLVGFILAYSVTRMTPLHTPHTSLFIGLAGALAICAMLLPGISGSFVLVLLGKYTFMLQALQNFQLSTLAPFALGGIAGLLIFSRGIARLLHRHHDNTLSLLAGFMLGSLNKVWPWQQSWSTLTDNSAGVPRNLSPLQFQAIYHQDPLVIQALLWMSLGVLLVVGLEKQVLYRRRSDD